MAKDYNHINDYLDSGNWKIKEEETLGYMFSEDTRYIEIVRECKNGNVYEKELFIDNTTGEILSKGI